MGGAATSPIVIRPVVRKTAVELAATFSTYQQVADPNLSATLLLIFNSTDQDIYISMDGTLNHIVLEAGENIAIDLGSNGTYLHKGIWVKAPTPPTSGTFRLTIIQ